MSANSPVFTCTKIRAFEIQDTNTSGAADAALQVVMYANQLS